VAGKAVEATVYLQYAPVLQNQAGKCFLSQVPVAVTNYSNEC